MADNELRVINRDDLVALGVSWKQVVDVLEDAFRQKAQGQVQNPPKPKVAPTSDSFVNAMPAFLGGSQQLGLKWVSGFEQNHAKGLPYIYGSVIMNDAATGRPIALLDGGWVTEMRTAGASGVTMRHVPQHVRSVGIIGAGRQGRAHLEVALDVHPEIEEVRIYDHLPEHGVDFLRGAGDRAGVVAKTPTEAIEGVDLAISCITRPLKPKLDGRGTSPDALILPVDYDDAFGPDTVSDAAYFCLDDLEQYASVRHRAFHDYREPDGDLAAVVSGTVDLPSTGRRVFTNMGIAMDDVALGGLVLELARERGVGQVVRFP